MRRQQISWAVGAFVGAIDAGLVALVMTTINATAGKALNGIAESLALAFTDGPSWLGAAFTGGLILAAAVVGGWAARQGRDRLLPTALTGVAVLVGSYVGWTFVWTIWRLGTAGGLTDAPFLPINAAILAFAALLLPTIFLFLPACLLWVGVMRMLVDGTSAQGRTSP